MTYIILAAVIIMALLLGSGRSLFGDITHLLSAAGAFVLALIFTPKISGALVSVLADSLLKQSGITALTGKIMSAVISPVAFTLVFIVLFTAIGLITHIVNNIVRSDKKPKPVPKLIINLIAGLLIGYAVLLPMGYYPHKLRQISEISQAIGITANTEGSGLEKYGLPEIIYRPLINSLGKVTLENVTVSADDVMEAYHTLSNLNVNDDAVRQQLLEQLKDDPEKDELYGAVIGLLTDRFSSPYTRTVMQQPGRMSAKYNAAMVMSQLLSIFRSQSNVNVMTLRALLKTADADSYEIVASVCQPETFDVYNARVIGNAPLIAQILREMVALEDRSDETIKREAEALNYILSPCGFNIISFNYDEMNSAEAARLINDSVILQNSYIKVTEGGSVNDPCFMSRLVYPDRARAILKVLTSDYSLSTESELYRSLIAYFGLTAD